MQALGTAFAVRLGRSFCLSHCRIGSLRALVRCSEVVSYIRDINQLAVVSSVPAGVECRSRWPQLAGGHRMDSPKERSARVLRSVHTP